jgi:hypothetical protein
MRCVESRFEITRCPKIKGILAQGSACFALGEPASGEKSLGLFLLLIMTHIIASHYRIGGAYIDIVRIVTYSPAT